MNEQYPHPDEGSSQKLQSKLEDCRKLTRSMEEVAQMGSYEIDLPAEKISFSEGLFRIFGEEPGAFEPDWEYIDSHSTPEDAATVRKVLAQAALDKKPYYYTRRIQRKDGTWRTVVSNGKVICNEQAEAIKLFGVVQDITEKTELVQTIQKSEAQFRLIAAVTFDIIYKMSADWSKMYILAGKDFLSDTASLTETWLDKYIPPAEQQQVHAVIKKAIQTKSIFEHEHPVILIDGSVGWVHSRAMPVLDEEGEIVEWIGAARNITNSKQREQELKVTKETLQATLDGSLYTVQAFKASRDKTGKIIDFIWVFTNKAWNDRYGDVIGKSLLNLNPGVIETGLFEKFVRVTETGVSIDHEQFYDHEQFNGWFHQTLVKMDDGFVMNTEDITDRKKAEQEIKAVNERLAAILNVSATALATIKAIRNEKGKIKDFEYEWLNDAAIKLTGFDATGKRMLETFPNTKNIGLFDLMVQTVEENRFTEIETHYDSGEYHLWLHYKNLKLDDGLMFSCDNITERKETEQEIVKNLAILKQSEEIASTGSWEYDINSQSMLWSDGMYELFELERGITIKPEIYLDFIIPADRNRMKTLIEKIKEDFEPFEDEVTLLIGNRKKNILIKATVVYNEAGKPVKVLGVDMNITEKRAAEAKLKKAEENRLKEVLNAVIIAQEEERSRIAEILHNEFGQILSIAKMRLPPEQFEVSALLNQAITKVRQISYELMPPILEDYGLEFALNDLMEKKLSEAGINYTSNISGLKKRIAPVMEVAVFRIIQELLNNIIKHARADFVELSLAKDVSYLSVRLSDNGLGVFAEAVKTDKKRKGFGLNYIRNRIQLLKGSIKIDLAPGKGTTIFIELPVE